MTLEQKRTILVFGATGAMGSYFVKHLLADRENNWYIRVQLDRQRKVQISQFA